MLIDLERGRKDFIKLQSRPMYSLGPFKAKGKDAGALQEELEAALSSVPVEGSIVRLVVNDVPSALYRSLDQNSLRAIGEKAAHLELKFDIVQGTDAVQWRSTAFGSLDQEFQSYLSQVPVEGVDKEDLRRRGLEYLRKEDGE
jgi:hypothetical protein